jgi:drug/metabolite transporter (DMT)-like permease
MMKSPAELSGRDLILLALLTISWGLNWPVMKIGVRELGPMTFRSISMIGGLTVLWLIIRSRGLPLRVGREHWRELLMIAMTNMAIWYVLAMYGVKLLSSGRAAILGYTMPIWVAIFGIVVFGERPSRRLGIGVAAAAVGIALLLASEFATLTGRPAGTLCMLGAAAVWGMGTHLMRRRRQKTNVLVITFWSLVVSLAVCGLIAVGFEREQWVRVPDAAEWGAIAYNSLVVLGFSQVMWFRLATILPPVASGLSVMLIPAIGLFSGMAILGERPHWQDFAALAAILVAIGAALLPARAPESVR